MAAAVWFSALQVPWWIAGGWALDLYLGTQSRAHADLDIGVLRRDITAVLAALPSWEFFEAKDGVLAPLRVGEAPQSAVHSLWCRPVGSTLWTLELLLDECFDGAWCYRREPSIRRPFSAMIQQTPSGIPYLAPEIQLLYKARSPRSQDQADCDLVGALLDTAARTWLVNSLVRTETGHPWISALTVDVREARVDDRDILAGPLDA